MQKGGAEGKEPFFPAPFPLPVKHVVDDAADDFVNAEGMAEPAMFRAVKGQIGRSELPDPPQALELLRADQIPNDPVGNVDVTVNRILKHLFFIQFFRSVRHGQSSSFIFLRPREGGFSVKKKHPINVPFLLNRDVSEGFRKTTRDQKDASSQPQFFLDLFHQFLFGESGDGAVVHEGEGLLSPRAAIGLAPDLYLRIRIDLFQLRD
jgi:hypothetical protein